MTCTWTTDGKEIRGGAGGGDDMYYLVVKVTLGADQLYRGGPFAQ